MPSDVELLRLVLARELETINQYETFARTAHSELVRAFFQHLAEEEKEHVAEATVLLQQLDAGQRAHFQKADVRIEHFLGQPAKGPSGEPGLPGAMPSVPSQQGQPKPTWTFTVGSLKRR